MLYKSTKTGRIIDVESVMGGQWVPVVAPAEPEKPAKKPASKTGKKAKDKASNG